MRLALVPLAFSLVISAALPAFAKSSGPTLQDQQQAACYDDVQKFCGTALPDEAKVRACMEPLKEKVSAKCRAMWDVKG